MVVVLGVAGVRLLLLIGPAAHVLQAARGVPPFDQADGLREQHVRPRGCPRQQMQANSGLLPSSEGGEAARSPSRTPT